MISVLLIDYKIFYSPKAVQDRPSVQIFIMLFPWGVQIHFLKKTADVSIGNTEIISSAVRPHTHGRIIIGKRTVLIIAVDPLVSGRQHRQIRPGFQIFKGLSLIGKFRQIVFLIRILIRHAHHDAHSQKPRKHRA